MKRVYAVLVLILSVSLFCGCALSADVPREPPQMTVRSQAGKTGAVRFGWEWEIMKRRNEVGPGIISDSVDPLLWEYDPIPVFTGEDLTLVFPEGMDPLGVSVAFYLLNEAGEADRDAVHHMIAERFGDRGGDGSWGVVLRGEWGLHAQDGIFGVEAEWNKPRYRGRATYAFAVTPREIGE